MLIMNFNLKYQLLCAREIYLDLAGFQIFDYLRITIVNSQEMYIENHYFPITQGLSLNLI